MAEVEEENQKKEQTKPVKETNATQEAHAREMSRIEDLWRSPNPEDRIRSLELFKEKYPKLPFGRVSDYIEIIKNESDPKVKSKADEVYGQTAKPDFERWEKHTREFMETVSIPLETQLKSLEKLQNLFSSSQKLAGLLENNLHLPIIDIKGLNGATKILEGFEVPEIISPPSLGMYERWPSPIMASHDIAEAVLGNEDERLTLPDLLGIPEDEIRDNLSSIKNAKSDIVFNYNGYRFLYDIERILREVIQKRIIEPNEKSINNLIPPEIISECKEIQDLEKKNGSVVASERWIDYCDFTHLEMILRKGKNKDKLKDILNEQEFESVVSKLHELDPIRKKIAHSRPLTTDELNKIRIYGKDIARLFSEDY